MNVFEALTKLESQLVQAREIINSPNCPTGIKEKAEKQETRILLLIAQLQEKVDRIAEQGIMLENDLDEVSLN